VQNCDQIDSTKTARWQSEQEFFDGEEYSDKPLDDAIIERYLACKHPFLLYEYPFAFLGDVHGKRIFDFGCGDGGDAILFGLRGADVVGVDISTKAIAGSPGSVHAIPSFGFGERNLLWRSGRSSNRTCGAFVTSTVSLKNI
jgi:SAM-dependent methyltransferase